MLRYRLIGLDRFSYEYYTVGEYNTLEAAEEEQLKCQKEAKNNASDSSIEDRYWIQEI